MFSLWSVKCIFFWFYQRLGFKMNIFSKYAKKGSMSVIECTDLAAFTFAT